MNDVVLMEARFRIAEPLKTHALRALQSLAWLAPDIGELCGWDELGPIIGYAGVDVRTAARAATLEEAVAAWGWELICDETGDVSDIRGPDCGKLCDESRLFEAIAPFVDDGSYIQIQRDDDLSIWRWVFAAGSCRFLRGRLVFE